MPFYCLSWASHHNGESGDRYAICLVFVISGGGLFRIYSEPEHAMLQLAMKAFCCATPVNADGFGLAWYHPDISVPGAYKDVTPGTL